MHINNNGKGLCRLRLSSHRLFIERGRWKFIPRLLPKIVPIIEL